MKYVMLMAAAIGGIVAVWICARENRGADAGGQSPDSPSMCHVRNVIETGGDINALGPTGSAWLHHAAGTLDLEMAKLLVKNGANVDVLDQKAGETPLFRAAGVDGDGREMIRFLVNSGAKVDAKNRRGETPLIYAAALGRCQAVAALIAGGADIRRTDDHGTTALGSAVVAGNRQIVELLLKHGADPLQRLGGDPKNQHESCTVLEAAKKLGFAEIAALLESYSAQAPSPVSSVAPVNGGTAAESHSGTQAISAVSARIAAPNSGTMSSSSSLYKGK